MRFCLKPPEPAAGSSAGWGGKAQGLLLCTARKSSLLPAAPRAARPRVKHHRSAAGTARGHAQQHMHCPGVVSPLCIVGQCHGLAVAVLNRRKTEPQEKGQKPQGVCCLSAESESGAPMLGIALQGRLVKTAANQENHPDRCPYQRGEGEKPQGGSLDAPGWSRSMSRYTDPDRTGNASNRKASGGRGRAEPPLGQDQVPSASTSQLRHPERKTRSLQPFSWQTSAETGRDRRGSGDGEEARDRRA